jgi:hypothetical protein
MLTRERSEQVKRRPAGDFIRAVVENMRENREELRYSVVVPSRYTVLLAEDDYARLEGLFPRLQAEAERALNEELTRLNRQSWLRRQVSRWAKQQAAPLENADAQWHVEFVRDLDGEIHNDGDIVVHSELKLPGEPELAGGTRTRRIATLHAQGATSTRRIGEDVAVTPASAVVHARLTYTDSAGSHGYDVVRDSTTIGRGGVAYPVDIRVTTSEDVSREHARIRRDPATGRMFLIDLSTLGTTLNGRHVPRGVEDMAGGKRENGVETELPIRCRIGLAESVFIEFEKVD